ncbi:copper resistance protein B [Parasphingorhabdus sp.]|uniref:copper resistance protein B n=1 Tax=Parasphingorhabdus sp. TaxID=2709688 RepID=UPI003266B45D
MMKRILSFAAICALSSPVLALEDNSQMDHSKMDHGEKEQVDHSDHGMPPKPSGTTESAGSGPANANAADSIWGKEAMQPSRDALYDEHGNMKLFWFQGDRIEYRARDGKDGYLWDVQGYYGGDSDKLWFKSEGEGSFGEEIEQAEVQALWSHAIGPFFDFQAGVRQDFHGPDRTHLVVGAQGVAPYFLEIDIATFLSNKGDLTARVEGEYSHRVTQKLILQPRAEINFSAQDIPELETGSGIDSIEAGIRLRYEITPEFGPYVGVEQEWKLGSSRDFAIADGEDPSVTNYVVGVRFWF